MFNYETKSDSKMQRVLIHHILLKSDLQSLKSNVDELDIDKFKNVPSSLSNFKIKVDKLDVDKLVLLHFDMKKLIDSVDKQVIKKYAYDELVKNVKSSNTNDLLDKAYSRNNEIEKPNTDHDHGKYITIQD